jgi:hypothetical protein
MIRLSLFAAAAILAVDLGAAAPTGGAEFPPIDKSVKSAWKRYIAAAERRISVETADPVRFLAMDFVKSPAAARQAAVTGRVPVSEMAAERGVDGRELDVPDAWVHHWRGAILLPRATLDHVLARLKESVPKSTDVLASAIRSRSADGLQVFLQVERRQSLAGLLPIRLVYNTDHAVAFARHSAVRASSVSIATRIAQVDGAGSASPRELAPGDDYGFLWRWHSYWRYEQVQGGVIAECEAISLSRGAPIGTRYIAARLASGAAIESMTRALVSLRQHVGVPTADRKPRGLSPAQSASR